MARDWNDEKFGFCEVNESSWISNNKDGLDICYLVLVKSISVPEDALKYG
jgi:hypothetical protein